MKSGSLPLSSSFDLLAVQMDLLRFVSSMGWASLFLYSSWLVVSILKDLKLLKIY